MDILKDIRIVEYPNGFRLIFKECKYLPIISLQLWVRVGSIDENDENNGISHFVEHMLFKGTEKYGLSEISEIIESYGGRINAATGKESTVYWVDAPKDCIWDAIDIIYEMAFKPKFDRGEFMKEKMVIIEEIKRMEDYPEDILVEEFNKLLFTETAYKFRIIGTFESVSSLDINGLSEYCEKFYSPNNMFLVVVGDIETRRLIEAVENSFGREVSKDIPARGNLSEPLKGEKIKSIKRKTENVRILSGFLLPPFGDITQFPAELLSTILGVGLSSRFNRKLKEEKRLAWDISCGIYPQIGRSVFYIAAYSSVELYKKLIDEIKEEIRLIMEEGPTREEVLKGKEMLVSDYIFSLEEYHEIASSIGHYFFVDKLHLLRNYLDIVQKIEIPDMIEILKKYYKGLVTTILHPSS